MHIAYLTQLLPSSNNTDIILPAKMTEALADRGHKVLVIAASDKDYSYHIYRNNITIVQLRSVKCPLILGQQPVLLPFFLILQSLRQFRPDILYMDAASSMNWIGHVYSLISRVPTKPAPPSQIKLADQN